MYTLYCRALYYCRSTSFSENIVSEPRNQSWLRSQKLSEQGAECEAAMTKLCGSCNQSVDGRACWESCKAEHEAELSSVCVKAQQPLTRMMQGKGGVQRGDSECEAALSKICGACAEQLSLFGMKESGHGCWAQCIHDNKAELAAACAHQRTVPVQ